MDSFWVIALRDSEIFFPLYFVYVEHISHTQHCKPKQLHIMTCSAVFEWFEQHGGLQYSKQSEEYCMGVPPAALGLLGSIVVVMHILLYI